MHILLRYSLLLNTFRSWHFFPRDFFLRGLMHFNNLRLFLLGRLFLWRFLLLYLFLSFFSNFFNLNLFLNLFLHHFFLWTLFLLRFFSQNLSSGRNPDRSLTLRSLLLLNFLLLNLFLRRLLNNSRLLFFLSLFRFFLWSFVLLLLWISLGSSTLQRFDKNNLFFFPFTFLSLRKFFLRQIFFYGLS